MTERTKERLEFMGCLLGGMATGGFIIFLVVFGITYIDLWTSKLSGQAKFNKAEMTRKIVVIEAQAKLDSSALLARAEVERAKGVAEANKIIGDSLKGNESYLRYLWIDSLQHTKDKIIYVPTEAGLPLLESTRLNRK